jgi:putative RecB family exonuclease
MSGSLLTLDQPQQRSGGVWDYVSPSRLNLWLRCPLSWNLRYVDGIRTPTSPALFVGKCTHSALEDHYRHRMLGITLPPDEVISRMDANWDQTVADEQMDFESTTQETTLRQKVADLVQAYLLQVPDDEPRPLAVEATMEVPLVDPFTGEDLGIPLLGIVDLVLDDADGPVVRDFKTSSRSASPFEVTHEIQLTSYGYLFRRTTGLEEIGLEIHSLIKTKKPKVEGHRYPARTDAHFRRLFAVIREYLDALDRGRFNYRPGWGCAMCDFRQSHCLQWSG